MNPFDRKNVPDSRTGRNLGSALAIVLLASCGGAVDIDDAGMDHVALTQGVSSIDLGGAVPSALVVYGESAFPVAVDGSHHTFIAAARVGTGRVVHFGHDAFLAGRFLTAPGTTTLLRNAIAWTSPHKTPTIGVSPELDQLAGFLQQQGFAVKTTSPSTLAGIDVYFTYTSYDYSDADVRTLREFMQSGGGLVSAGLAWAWGQSPTHTHPARDYPGNKYLRAAGIGISTTIADEGVQQISQTVIPDVFHARKALLRLADHASSGPQLPGDEQSVAIDTVNLAVDFLGSSTRR